QRAQLPLRLVALERPRQLAAHHHAARMRAEELGDERGREHVRAQRLAVQREYVVALEEGVVGELPVRLDDPAALVEEAVVLEAVCGELGSEPVESASQVDGLVAP